MLIELYYGHEARFRCSTTSILGSTLWVGYLPRSNARQLRAKLMLGTYVYGWVVPAASRYMYGYAVSEVRQLRVM
jgi:hypothetical protein